MRGGYTNYNLPKVTENNKYAGGYYRPARRNGDGLGFGGLMGIGCGASRPQGEIPAGFVHQGNNRNHVEQRNGVNTLVKNTSNEIRDAEVEGISKPNQGRSGRPLSPHRGRLDPSLRQGASMPGPSGFASPKRHGPTLPALRSKALVWEAPSPLKYDSSISALKHKMATSTSALPHRRIYTHSARNMQAGRKLLPAGRKLKQ